MFMPVFARNPIEYAKFSGLDIAMVGAGSIGSTLFDILVRTGVGSLSVFDPEDFAAENVGRHVLTASSVGKPKVEALAKHALSINPDCRVRAIKAKFDPALLSKAPDLILSTADSFLAASLVNGYALRHKIPAVFGGVWGEASVAEIVYVIPSKTPCYECFAGFRRNVEIPKDERRYTDPNYDDTRIPGQAGLWANILMVAGLQFQVILGLVGLRDTLRFPGNVWLMNISDPKCAFQPLALTVGDVKKGCAVCDATKLEELRKENLSQAAGEPDMSEFNPGVSIDVDTRKKEFAGMVEILERGKGEDRSVQLGGGLAARFHRARRALRRYFRLIWWIYLPVYAYRRILRMWGTYDPNEPMFPEWLTESEKRAIGERAYRESNIVW